MEEKTKNILRNYVLPGVLVLALVLVGWWGLEQRALAADYKNITESMYRRAYGDLSDSLYDMESTLAKLLAVNSPAQRVLLLDELWRLSGGAVSSMSQIPSAFPDTEEVNRFVVRLGDYAHSLTKRTISGDTLSQEDLDTLKGLRESCRSLAQRTAQRLEEGDIPLESLEADAYYSQTQDPAGTGDNAQGEEGILEFPTLIYDGPFSESAEKLEPKGLTGQDITEEEARAIAEGITGCSLQSNGLVEGSIPAYDFSYAGEDGSWAEIEITRQGGAILWYMKPASGNAEGKPEDSEARRYRNAALQKLRELGYENMQATYAQYYGGAALINFAATQGDVILYSDLVKVWVDRETLEVIGIDARNYLFSHVERALPEATLPPEEAEAKIAPQLNIESRALALIPITPETERLCYEFKCTLEGDSYIIYINAETGAEEQVFRIIDSEDGTLVI